MYIAGNGDVTHWDCIFSPGMHIVFTGDTTRLKVLYYDVIHCSLPWSLHRKPIRHDYKVTLGFCQSFTSFEISSPK